MERSGSRGAFNRHGAHLRVSRAAIREERPDAAAGFRAGRLHRAGAVRCATVGGADRGVRGGTKQQSGDVSRVRCGGVDAAGRGVGESDERAGGGVCDRGARAASYGGDSGEVYGVEGVGIRRGGAETRSRAEEGYRGDREPPETARPKTDTNPKRAGRVPARPAECPRYERFNDDQASLLRSFFVCLTAACWASGTSLPFPASGAYLGIWPIRPLVRTPKRPSKFVKGQDRAELITDLRSTCTITPGRRSPRC